jgi:hypothetical protein
MKQFIAFCLLGAKTSTSTTSAAIRRRQGSRSEFCCSDKIERRATSMRHLLCAPAVLAMLTIAVSASGGPQATLTVTVVPPASLLPSDRDASANWRMAGLLSIGGIPNRTTQCGKTLTPIGGGADDTIAIQTAINNCTAGQVVQLGAGTFTVAEGSYILLNKAVTLRGAGAGSTILTRPQGPGSWSSQSACSSSGAWGATTGCSNPGNNPTQMIIASPLARFVGNATTGCALTADGAKGATTITLTSGCASNFSPGQIVLLDELTGAEWQTDVEYPGTQIWASPDYRIVTHVHNPTVSGDDCTTIPPTPANCSVLGTTFTVHNDSLTNEFKRVASVSGNSITFDSPLTISYRAGHTAQLWSFATPHLQQAGIENLSVSNADDNGIEWDWCAFCWAKNVEMTNWLGRGFEVQTSFRVQLEGVYVHDGAWCVPGSGGYNIGIDFASSEVLVENSISIRCNKVIVVRAAGAGSVAAYNYMDMGYIAGTTSWVEAGLNASHLVGSHHMLFEGNWGFNAESDNTHGASNYITFFRNDITGVRQTFTGEDGVTRNDGANCNGATASPMRAIGAHVWAWWFSGIGNVLGTANCTIPENGWTLNGTYATNLNINMYGWDDENGGNATFADPNMITIYPAIGPNCPATSNCATIDSGNWLIGWTNTNGQTIWDPNHTGSDYNPLSQTHVANDTATIAHTGSVGNAFSTSNLTVTGKKVYAELSCINPTDIGFSLTNTESPGNYFGADLNSMAFYLQGGIGNNAVMNGNALGAWSDCANGDILGLMIDTTVSPITISEHNYHAGTWGSTFGPFTLSSQMSGGVRLWLAIGANTVGEGSTICGAASCAAGGTGEVPTGYVWWDTVANINAFSQTPPTGLPSSLYLNSRPTFAAAGSGYPWPWVTPENGPTTPIQSGPPGCGGTCSGLPAKARWDNGTPFTQP